MGTIAKNSHTFSVFGDKAAVVADLAFSGVYEHGGISIDHDALLGIHTVEAAFIEMKAGYSFVHDKANKKIKVFGPAPPICYEEHHVLDSSYQFKTKYPAAYFMNMAAIDQNIAFRSTGIAKASLSAGQCCLASQMAEGELTTITVSPANQTAVGAIGDGTGWTAGGDWAAASNEMHKASSADTTAVTLDTWAAKVGHTYRVIYAVKSYASGGVKVTLGGVNGTVRSADGTYTEDIVATSTAGLGFTPSGTSHLSVDDVYILDLDVYATYVTQAWKEVWDNVVQDESVTLSSSGAVSLANQALAVMYLDQITATAGALVFGDEDESAADSGKVSIALNQTADAVLTSHADQNAKVCKLTYIKNPLSGFLYDRAFDNESATKAGGGDPYSNTFDYPLLLWGYCGQAPVVNGTTQTIIPYFGTTAAGTVVFDWFAVGARGAGNAVPAAGFVVSGTSNVTLTAAGVWGRVDEIVTVPLEVADGVDLSNLTSVKALFIGL